MLKEDAVLSIQRIGLDRIQVTEFQQRYLDRLSHYTQLLKDHPGEDPGCLFVTPSHSCRGMYSLLDGYHRFTACILVGRKNVLCVVVQEPPTKEHAERKEMPWGRVM